ncbi:uncharacterized protein LOC141630738 [Silene latifolia]|uniref:uncharacterized protein LOC141630738 n=1 Tax=Silene latifolia TaxID=37657 RepID=UPI003D7752BB
MIYASNDAREREDLWQHLVQLKSSVDQWILLGDFNVVRDVTERISDTPPVLADILDFNNCLYQCEVEDLPSTGCDLTWNNKQDTGTRVWSKLDRALGNSSWLTKFHVTSANYLAPGISDHSPIVVTIFDDPVKKPTFSFLNCWVEDPDYDNLVQQAWQLPVSGSNTFKFFEKLKNVRKALKNLHGTNYTGIQAGVATLKKELLDCQSALQAKPLSADLIAQEKEVLQNYCKFKRIEKSILRQTAKVSNIKHNDCSSKFF